ncbi:hypothetical protein [Thiomonas sp. FB-Cd]|uniref:hypothetical protein n=1 Tax=Thiomonas sp. FB-Cd TaxID=1158292 RepID=UPI0004DF1203|nr:hypothetical protein [Thiomonas sp. FB-Cd]
MNSPQPFATVSSHATAPEKVGESAKQRLRFRPLTPIERTKLALALQQQTLSEATESIRALGVAPRRETAQTLLERRATIDNVRRSRAARRQPSTQPALAQRLRTYKASKIFPVAKSLFRHGAAGGGTFKLWFVERSSEVSYKVDIGSNRDTYRGSFKGWSATEDHHRIWVPRDWAARVLAHGLADLDGMMTLDAHRLMSPDGIMLYAATWAAQSRGYSVTTHRGFIAVSGGLSFHADSAEQAVAGIRRKVTAAGRPPRQRVSPLDIDIGAFVQRYRRYDVTVDLDDARESGSCEYGIRSWCEAVGLDYDEGEAPLADILTAFQGRPQVEVRLAVLHAIRRHRATLRKAA